MVVNSSLQFTPSVEYSKYVEHSNIKEYETDKKMWILWQNIRAKEWYAEIFATNEVQFTNNAIDTFLAFVDYMSCSADTYVSLGGSNGCADQLTNWDGTQKIGLGSIPQKKEKGMRR